MALGVSRSSLQAAIGRPRATARRGASGHESGASEGDSAYARDLACPRLTGSPVVALNRAVAVAEAGAPERALELVDS